MQKAQLFVQNNQMENWDGNLRALEVLVYIFSYFLREPDNLFWAFVLS